MPRSRYLVGGMPRRYDNHKYLNGARFREHYQALEETSRFLAAEDERDPRAPAGARIWTRSRGSRA